LDASTLADRFDVLSISVLTRGGAIRVAWTMLVSHQQGAWRSHWERMLQLLREAVPAEWQVLVMADRGLYAAWLFEAIVANGWHPLLRVNGSMRFRPTGSEGFVRIDARGEQGGQEMERSRRMERDGRAGAGNAGGVLGAGL
jgi:hypothetical protein